MRIPYLKWALFFVILVLLEQFAFKFFSEDLLPSLDDKKVMAALSVLTSGDEPTWDSFDDEIRIPLERKGGVWVVNVELNNIHEANLILDSGASFTTLSEDVGFEIGLSPDPYLPKIPMNTANGKTEGWVATVESIRVGDTERTNVMAVVADLSNLTELGIDGLLGLNFLDGFVWRLDHQTGFLILEPKPT